MLIKWAFPLFVIYTDDKKENALASRKLSKNPITKAFSVYA